MRCQQPQVRVQSGVAGGSEGPNVLGKEYALLPQVLSTGLLPCPIPG